MQVEEDMKLMILGDMNARLTILEPSIEMDANGNMIEEWVTGKDMIHFDRSEKCIGKYTFGRPEGRRSAIDHVMVNQELNNQFKGMMVDENGEELNISDHNLVRCWFKIGREKPKNWKDYKTEYREWYTLDPKALGEMEKELEKRTKGPMSFKGMMAIIMVAQEKTPKKVKEDTNREKGKGRYSGSTMDGQKRHKTDKTKTGQE